MTADNWASCPKCEKQTLEEARELRQKVTNSYGKTSEGEYLKLAKESGKDIQGEPTLREDYEIGIYEGETELFIRYSCSCSVCGFSHSFRCDDPISL